MVTKVVRKGAKMSRRGDNIHKRKDGRWEGRYRCSVVGGTYKYRSIYGKTYREVKERLDAVLKEMSAEKDHLVSQGIEGHSADIPFCDIAQKWLTHIEKERKYSTYIKYLKLYKQHIEEALREASISDISDHFVTEKIFGADCSKDISLNMKHSILAVMNQILKYANEYCQCPAIRLSNKYSKDRNTRIEIINHSDQALLLRYLYQDIDISKAGIILCISTGLRLGEICSLEWEDIDLEQMIIHVNRTVQRIALLNQSVKTSLMVTPPKSVFSIREIPISETLAQILAQIKGDRHGYILSGAKPMEPRTYQNHFKRYLRAAKVKEYNFHTLRHTFATNCIDNGMDVKSLSEILGHSDIQITLNRYVHPTMDTKRRYMTALSSVYSQYCGQIPGK